MSKTAQLPFYTAVPPYNTGIKGSTFSRTSTIFKLFIAIPALYLLRHLAVASTSEHVRQILWGNCSSEASPILECGQLRVPMDWADEKGKEITLGMMRIKAKDPSSRIGSVVFNPGGPGGVASNICIAQVTGRSVFSEAVRTHFDIICPDPRGVGLSEQVQCDPALWNQRYTLFPTDNTSYTELIRHNRAFGGSCLDRTGDLLKYIDTVSAARDIEAVRLALNDGKLNWLGESYGTQLGYTYAELYPRNIRSMVLDGVLDHTGSEVDSFVTESKAYEDSLTRFFDWCRENETCALYGLDVGQIFDDLVVQANKTPIAAPDCLTSTVDTGTCFPNVTGEDILFNTQGFLLRKEALNITPARPAWQQLGQALYDSVHGNASLLSSPLAVAENSTVWLGLAIGCLDWAHSTASFEEYLQKETLGTATSPWTRGASQSYTLQTQCLGWPIPVRNPQQSLNETALALAPPILLVASTHDPSTSYKWAQNMLPQIPTGVLLTREGDGHTSYALGGEATSFIDSYLVNGTLPEPGTVVRS